MFGNSDFFFLKIFSPGPRILPFVRSAFGKMWELLLPFVFDIMFPEHWQLYTQRIQQNTINP